MVSISFAHSSHISFLFLNKKKLVKTNSPPLPLTHQRSASNPNHFPLISLSLSLSAKKMSHHPTNRRNLATQGPQISKPKSFATTTTASSTVHHLTHQLSRLNPNPQPTKHQNPPPQEVLNAHFKAKGLVKSASLDRSAQKFEKQGKRVVLEGDKKALLVVEQRKDNIVAKVEREHMKGEGGNHGVMKVVGGVIEKRSFCDAQMELANFLAKNCAKVVSADMPPFMKIHAVGLARKTKDSLEKFTSKSLALALKKEFDGAYGHAWHCIVGTSFGSFVTHSVGGFLYFSLDQKLYVLLFKTGVQRAN